MRKVFALIVLAALVLSAVSCDGLKKTVYVCGACKNEVEPSDYSCPSCGELIVIPENDANEITYTSVTIETIHEEWEQNAARAENQYLDEYVELSGTVSEIAADFSFKLCDRIEIKNEYDMIWLDYNRSAACKLAKEELKDTVLTLNKGDNITIKGKIIKLQSYSLLDIKIEVYEIVSG